MITVYISTSCGYCAKAISYMKELGLKYQVVDVTDAADLRPNANLPVFFTEVDAIVGFDTFVEEYPL